jgi:D-glycero-beta-D-manno-heptose-7-phosphate kinase
MRRDFPRRRAPGRVRATADAGRIEPQGCSLEPVSAFAARDAPAVNFDRFADATVVVAGDLGLDHYMVGTAYRLARDHPIPVLEYEADEYNPGEAANAAANVAAMGGRVRAVGMVGDDAEGDRLVELLAACGVDTRGVVRAPGRRTTTKTRVTGRRPGSAEHHIVRVDRTGHPPSAELEEELDARLADALLGADALIMSDYGQGTVTDRLLGTSRRAPVRVVDARRGLVRYRGVSMATPDVEEAAEALGFPVRADDDEAVAAVGAMLRESLACEALLMTRGAYGMTLAIEGHASHLPPINRSHVVDATGAGDTAVAALTLARTSGASYVEAARLASYASALAVSRLGAAPVELAELRQVALARG